MIKMEPYEEQQLIEQLKSYHIKPMSMKYLKNLTSAKNPKNKKKQDKKKAKKKKLLEGEKEEGQSQKEVPESEEISESMASELESQTVKKKEASIPAENGIKTELAAKENGPVSEIKNS
jgi:mRNA deadenylase 3'-5' endonuclease subunit Ccr4